MLNSRTPMPRPTALITMQIIQIVNLDVINLVLGIVASTIKDPDDR